MRLTLTRSGFTEAITALIGAPERIRKQWAVDAYRVGTKSVSYATRTYRRAADTTPAATAVRTSRLWRSYTHEVKESATGVELSVGVFGSDVEQGVLQYAAIHEYGGTIRPTNAQYLTLPLPAVKMKAGVVRGGARAFNETFVAKSKRGNLILFQRQGQEIVPLFLLTKGPIRIPARPSLAPTAERVTIPELERAVRASFSQVFERR